MLTMAFGALWEIIEFTMDTFFLYGDPMQHGNTDTMLGMTFVMFGAIIVAALGILFFNIQIRPPCRCSLQIIPTIQRFQIISL